MHINVHYTPNTTHPTATLLYTQLKHICVSRQNDRCWDDIYESVVVSFPSILVVVFFLGFHPHMHLFSFRKHFCDL